MEVVKEHYLLHSFTFRFQVNYNETTLLTVLVFLPNMKLSSFFSLLGISCLLIFEWIRNALLFFWPVIFLCWHLIIFWCFSEHEAIIFFSLLGISCLLIFEWIRNALLFFWSVVFSNLHLFNFWCFSEHETIHFFILYGQFVSTHTWEWIGNALYFCHFDIITLWQFLH